MSAGRFAAVLVLATVAVGSEPVPVTSACLAAQDVPKEFSVHARKYAFDPARIEVQQGDLVKITLISDDIPHSFTVDSYRIARRVAGGQTTVFEFRAEQTGAFQYYCNLTADERCKDMHGQIVVRPR